jgi:uncharacterized protein YhaN
MATGRSKVELELLRLEAERRVRAGQSRAEVSRVLGVAPMTLAGWALKYRWRQKDLEEERRPEATQAAIERIRNALAQEQEEDRRRVADAEAFYAESVRVDEERKRLAREKREEIIRKMGEYAEAASARGWDQGSGRDGQG